MKSGAILTLLACLCLTFNAEAFNFGKLLGTIAGTVDGVGNLLNGILGGLATEQLGFLPDVDFKARLVGANALCQLESRDGIRESDTMCGDFGKRYYSEAAGKWACGRLRSDAMGVYSCMYKPSLSFIPHGLQIPDVVFRSDEWRETWRAAGQSHGRALCSDRKPMVDVEAVDDEIEPAFHDSSSFYAKALAADLYKYTSAFNDTLGESEAHTTAVLTTAVILKALDVAGIRYPIGRRVCQLCKGTCNRIMPKDSIDTCKYKVCVGFLGGVSVKDGETMSCEKVSRP